MKSPEIEKRHAELYSARMNEATWPGKDLWEIAELQLKLAAAEKRIEELEKALQDVAPSHHALEEPQP